MAIHSAQKKHTKRYCELRRNMIAHANRQGCDADDYGKFQERCKTYAYRRWIEDKRIITRVM